jgi:AmmeMemoRadiSam system protein B
MNIREPIFAQQGWYPASESRCRQTIEEYLASFPKKTKGQLAGIVPHAGWIYSGRTAAWTFAALKEAEPDVVFVFGGHMHPGERCICMPEGAFGTPLGPVEVAEDLGNDLFAKFDCVEESPMRFTPDNTIELQMPFIKAVWPQAKVLAIQAPPSKQAIKLGDWAATIAMEKDLKAVAIGSTDLTHYGANYGFTPKGLGAKAYHWSNEENDKPFIDLLLKLDAQKAMEHALTNHSACCSGAAAAAASFARARGAKAGQLIQHTTSHELEKTGEPSMWVGYASIVF